MKKMTTSTCYAATICYNLLQLATATTIFTKPCALMNSGWTPAISSGVQPLKHSTRRATKPCRPNVFISRSCKIRNSLKRGFSLTVFSGEVVLLLDGSTWLYGSCLWRSKHRNLPETLQCHPLPRKRAPQNMPFQPIPCRVYSSSNHVDDVNSWHPTTWTKCFMKWE